MFTELKAECGQMSTGDKTFSINKKQSSFFLLALKISSRVKDAKIPSEGVVALLKSGKGGGGGSEGSRVHGNVINVIMAKRTARVC